MPYYLLLNIGLITGGCFLPWVHQTLFVVRLRGVDMIDGKVLLILAVAALLVLLYQQITKRSPRWIGWAYGMIGGAVVLITGLDLYDYYNQLYPVGPGIYLCFLGGVQLLGHAVFRFKKQ
jgi:hypothetical protein